VTVAVGVVGLGNMGAAIAANLVGAGLSVVGTDLAGPDRAPAGVRFLPDVAAVAAAADVVMCSLPDGPAVAGVVAELVAAPGGRVRCVVDTSTIGVAAAQGAATALAAVGIGYVDAPVSGGVAGARDRTLAVMVAGSVQSRAMAADVLAALSDRRFDVGDRPGLAQAVKLANNFLSATALAATSEAVAFATAAGLDMAVLLEALDASSGRNTATGDKFPNHVLTGRYASGFANTLMAKDVALYLASVHETGGPDAFESLTAEVWERFATAEPGADFTRIHPFVAGSEPGD
jgi:3-hydroxyisobutyrate dehydrogenase